DRGVDQARIQRGEVLVADAQPCWRVEGRVGDEHVDVAHQVMQERLPVLRAQVDGHAALATVVDDPRVVVGAGRVAGAAHAVHVARRRLHLDDVGTEVRHHCGRDGTGDEIRRVDRADALEEARHGPTSWGAPYHEPRGGLTGASRVTTLMEG